MTVCIAAISEEPEKEKRILCVTDRKASSTEFSNEDASVKMYPLWNRWMAMFAGEDISPCLPIIKDVTKRLSANDVTVETVKTAFELSFQSYLSNLAAAKHLGRWRLSIEEFLNTGRKKFGADNFDAIWSAIEQVKLHCKFLVAGFDSENNPHLFTVQNPGCAEDRDVPGYWAIGNGDWAALSTLGFFQQNVITPIARTYYNVWAAKFMAEKASDVGSESFVDVITPEGMEVTEESIKIERLVRHAWDHGGKPSVPSGIVEAIEKLIMPSGAQKSELEP